jgi:hypothetical protein
MYAPIWEAKRLLRARKSFVRAEALGEASEGREDIYGRVCMCVCMCAHVRECVLPYLGAACCRRCGRFTQYAAVSGYDTCLAAVEVISADLARGRGLRIPLILDYERAIDI